MSDCRSRALHVLLAVLILLPRIAGSGSAGYGDLIAKARQTRSLAGERLLERKSSDGVWRSVTEVNCVGNALYIIMLRSTGLIEKQGSFRDEARLVRYMVQQGEPDGGFCKFPGSPSSRSVTHLAILAFRLALGEVAPRERPASWYRRNPLIDDHLAGQIRSAIVRADRYLEADHPTSRMFEFDYRQILIPVASYAACEDHNGLVLPQSVLFGAILRGSPLSKLETQFSAIPRHAGPALAILNHGARERAHRTPKLLRPVRRMPGLNFIRKRAVRRLAAEILRFQEVSGGWNYNVYYTTLNVMALHEAGLPLDAPPFRNALVWLRNHTYPMADGGTLLNWIDPDVWSTCLAIRSYLSIPGCRASDPEIRPSLNVLLRSQAREGSFAFATGSKKFPDGDSTGFCLLTLSEAFDTADAGTRKRIREALAEGREWLLPRQCPDGGFNAYDPSLIPGTRRPYGLFRSIFFDPPSTDLTGRVLSALAALGHGPDDPAVRRGLRYLVRTQARNGSWWCRWWAGYIPGAYFVLPAMGDLGIRYGESPPPQAGRLLEKSHAATMRAVAFLLDHQNPDGGWGETTRADEDIAFAGVGPSTPLHTAAALYALLSVGYPADSAEVQEGVKHLLSQATPDGQWTDEQVTFTLFPRTFYYPFTLYSQTLPLDALNLFLDRIDRTGYSSLGPGRTGRANLSQRTLGMRNNRERSKAVVYEALLTQGRRLDTSSGKSDRWMAEFLNQFSLCCRRRPDVSADVMRPPT